MGSPPPISSRGALTGALAGDTVTFGNGPGNSVFLLISGPVVNTFYYTGANGTDFTDETNYVTLASGGVVQSNPLNANSIVFIGSTSPTPSNLTPTLTGTATIGSLDFVSNGSSLAGTGTLTVATGDVTVDSAVTGNVSIAPAVVLASTGTWTVGNAAASLIDNGGISGAFGLVKAGSGTLVLAGADTYTGATTVSSGALNIQNAAALGGTSLVTVASGAALQMQGGITTSAATPLTLNGTGLGGKGALENVSGANTYTGLVTLAGNTTIGSDAGTLTLSNVGTITGSGFGLTLTGAGNGVVDSIIGTGAGTVSKTGAGTWTLNGVNTYTGATTIGAGTLALGAANSIATSSGVGLTASGATLDISAANQTLQSLTGVSGSIVNLGTRTLTLNPATSDSFAGNIQGTGGLTKTGAGTLVLSGTNNYSGTTTFNGGIVSVGSATNIGSGPFAFGGGELLTTGAATFGQAVTLNAGTNTVAAATGTTATYNGAIGGTGALTLGDNNNAGSIILGAANGFDGLIVNNGTVIANNAASFGTGSVTQNAGIVAAAAGLAALTTGGAYVQNGGVLTTAGTGGSGTAITIGGDYTMSPSSVLRLNFAGNNTMPFDTLLVQGNATLAGTLVLSFNSAPRQGDTFDILNTTGTITSPAPSFNVPVVAQGYNVTTTVPVIDGSNNVTVQINSVSLALLNAVPGATRNQAAILGYLDANVLTGPLFQAISNGINAANNSPSGLAQFAADVADQFNPEKFANFTRSAVFNAVTFSTSQFDNYLATQRSPQGDFLVGNGQIDSSNLTVVNSNIDPNLAGVSSQLLAWNPAPIGHGLLSDTPAPMLGGVKMRDTKEVASQTPSTTTANPINSFVMGNVVLGQNFSTEDLPHTDTTSGQVQVGADYRITPHLRAGAFFGFAHSDADLDNNGSKATIDSYSPGVYASYANKGWYANLIGSYGFNSYTEDRAMSIGGASAVAHGAPDGDQIVANLDTGYDFHSGNWTYGPLIGLQYVHLDVNSFSEDGAGALGADEFRGQAGDRFAAQPVGRAGQLPFPDRQGPAHTAPRYRVAARVHGRLAGYRRPARQRRRHPVHGHHPASGPRSALIDAGVSADLNGQVTVFGDYSVQAGQEKLLRPVGAGRRQDRLLIAAASNGRG